MAENDFQPQAPVGRLPLRLRPWQRLRGGRAFQRPRGQGVFRHSDAALIRILPPWETLLPPPAAPQRRETVAEGQRQDQAPDGSGDVSQVADRSSPVPVVAPAVFVAVGKPSGRRLGVVASRKVGNAVVRNRAKRIFRDVFRKNQYALPARCDVLVIVRKGFPQAMRQDLEAQFADVVRRAARSFGGGR